MKVTFDPVKDVAKHGVSLADAGKLAWNTALTWLDTRTDYGEARECGIGYIGLILDVVIFVNREGIRREISLREANRKEVKRYAEA